MWKMCSRQQQQQGEARLIVSICSLSREQCGKPFLCRGGGVGGEVEGKSFSKAKKKWRQGWKNR